MIKQRILISFLLVIFCFTLRGKAGTITLKTGHMDDVIGISSFIMNGKGEIFLYSFRLLRIFKFKTDGSFEKSFCRKGEGPGEINRVFRMYHNPVNDCLYLPEYYSMAKGKISIYDSNGNFKGLLKPEISLTHMDRISKIIFLNDGSYIIVTGERVGWKPAGKFFLTQDEFWVRYFSKDDKLVSDIFKTKMIRELSNAVRYGGPSVLFKPSIIVKKMPGEDYFAVSKTDENYIYIYNKNGGKTKNIKLDIGLEKLTDEEFNEAKKNLLSQYKGKTDSRMFYLAENMIKLEYKPIYWNQFLTPEYIILEKTDTRDNDGYVKTSKLIFFDWQGKKKGEKIVEGYLMDMYEDKGLIKYYDDQANEHFRIDADILDIKT